MARRTFTLNFESQSREQRELDDIEQRYESVKRNSGILRLKGEVVKADFQDLQFIADIGNGSCGRVSKMSYRGHVMAVKDMVRTSNKEDNKRIIMDLDVISRAEASRHIVLCYGYFISETSVKVCMEVMASCLHTLLRSANRLGVRIAEGYIGKISISIVQGLDYLKDHLNVIHRDVKPSNILLDWNGSVKLCDFGISGQLIESRAHTVQAGCPPYMAPERFDPRFNSDYDIRSDVWSVGISLVEIATGRYPYSHIDSEFAILAAIVRDPSPTLPMNMNFTVQFHDFVSQCLQKDFKCRPKYKALLIARPQYFTDVGLFGYQLLWLSQYHIDGRGTIHLFSTASEIEGTTLLSLFKMSSAHNSSECFDCMFRVSGYVINGVFQMYMD